MNILDFNYMASDSQSKTPRPREEVKVLYDYELTNAPGKSIIAFNLEYPPDGFTPPHRHGGATLVAFVTQGTILSVMNDNSRVYQAGESFMEMPGCHHTVSENSSQTENANMIAVFVVDTEVVKQEGYAPLTVLDDE
ncbi:cupin 2 [Penicillium bovifimosum]|uniref:Cupin 2 n=1 Tax=Penicillium bovifimosum TaxID=126998 RepID=A0A9W9KV20_9EURO|nr:cupin 2 [Penicillium bovifimosum]KAJ5120485.1 cupin 2 [Penicillium bovifimosum]